MLLEGHPITNVTKHLDSDGWTFKGNCSDCSQVWTFKLSSDDLEDQAAKEIKRRKRASGG